MRVLMSYEVQLNKMMIRIPPRIPVNVFLIGISIRHWVKPGQEPIIDLVTKLRRVQYYITSNKPCTAIES